MNLFFLFACTLGVNPGEQAAETSTDHQSQADADGNVGINWSSGSGSGSSSSTGSSGLRSGSFPMPSNGDSWPSEILPGRYDLITVVVECFDDMHVEFYGNNVTTQNAQYWFNDELLEFGVDSNAWTTCYWSEFPGSFSDELEFNGLVNRQQNNWLDDEHCNVMIVDNGGAARYLYLNPNGQGGYNWSTVGTY